MTNTFIQHIYGLKFFLTVFAHLIFQQETFAHETKIMAKTAIKAIHYNPTVTFIVWQPKTRTCRIKNKERCTYHPMEPCCNLSCNYYKLQNNNKINVGKIMLRECALESSLVIMVPCELIVKEN